MSKPTRQQLDAAKAARFAAHLAANPLPKLGPTESDLRRAAERDERAKVEADPRYERGVEGSYRRCLLALSDPRLAAASTDAELCALICSLRAADVAVQRATVTA